MADNGMYLVTGAARGIGFACAGALAAQGGDLLLCDLLEDALAEAASTLRAQGVHVQTLRADVTSQDDLDTAVGLLKSHGGLAGCVHAAGVGGTMANPERVIEVNLTGTIRLLDALLPVANAGAAVVCIASQSAHFWAAGASADTREILRDAGSGDTAARLAAALGVGELDGGTAYGLSKYGVMRLVVDRAGEFGARGLRLLSLSPGIIDTPMARDEMEVHTEAMRAIIEQTPVGARRGRPEEIGAVAAFLCSPGASFVSGVDILVDGGSTGQVLNAG